MRKIRLSAVEASSKCKQSNYRAETISSKMKRFDYVASRWDNSIEYSPPKSRAIENANKYKDYVLRYPMGRDFDSQSYLGILFGRRFPCMSDRNPIFMDYLHNSLHLEAQNQSANNVTQEDSLVEVTSNMSTSSVRRYGTEIFMGIPLYYEASISKMQHKTNSYTPTCYTVERTRSLGRRESVTAKQISKSCIKLREINSQKKLNRERSVPQVRNRTTRDSDPIVSLVRKDEPPRRSDEENPTFDEKSIDVRGDFLEAAQKPSSCDHRNDHLIPSARIGPIQSYEQTTKKNILLRHDAANIRHTERFDNISESQSPRRHKPVRIKASIISEKQRNGTKGSKIIKWHKHDPCDSFNSYIWNVSLERFRESSVKRKSMQFIRTPFEQSQQKCFESRKLIHRKHLN